MGAKANRVYLCGPIKGRDDHECVHWREQSKRLLAPLETLDPLCRDYRGRKITADVAAQIVTLDIRDIQNSAAVLVYFDRPSVGTAMEIRIADSEFQIPVFVVNASGEPPSPWLVYHASGIYSSLEDACAYIVREL